MNTTLIEPIESFRYILISQSWEELVPFNLDALFFPISAYGFWQNHKVSYHCIIRAPENFPPSCITISFNLIIGIGISPSQKHWGWAESREGCPGQSLCKWLWWGLDWQKWKVSRPARLAATLPWSPTSCKMEQHWFVNNAPVCTSPGYHPRHFCVRKACGYHSAGENAAQAFLSLPFGELSRALQLLGRQRKGWHERRQTKLYVGQSF